MTSLLVSLVILSWGVAGIFDKKALETGSLRGVFLGFGLFNLPVVAILLVVLSTGYPSWHLSGGTIFWESIDSLASIVAITAYFYAMSRCEASYVLAITAGYPIVGALLSVPVLGEPFSLMLLTASVLVSAGVAAVGFSADSQQIRSTWRQRLIVLSCVLLSTTLWGLLGIFEKKSLSYGQPLESMLALAIGRSILVVCALAFMAGRKQNLGLNNPKTWKFTWLSAALVMLGNICYVTSLAQTTAGFMVVITACYPLVMYIFALLALKEKLNWLRVLGILLIVAGAGLTALT